MRRTLRSAVDARPVYVMPEADLAIALEDGALCFTQPERADRYIPLRRVSRLIVPETVQMNTEVLCACARRGIPVIVQDDDGESLFRVVGAACGDTGLRQRLLDLTSDPDWVRRMTDWREANRARIAVHVYRRLHAPPVGSRPGRLATWIEQRAVRLAGREDARTSARHFQAMALARMQQALSVCGLDASDDSWLYDEVDLGQWLGDLLAFQLQPLRLGWLQRRKEWSVRNAQPSGPVRHRDLVRLFERHAGRVDRTVRDLINRLHRWLVETT